MHLTFQCWAVLKTLWDPVKRIMHEHVPFVWWLVLHVFTVALSHQSSAWDRITPFPSIRLLAIENCHLCTHRRYRRLLWTLSPVFSKGRSRVWLMSRLSWTGWLASRTPWFQLTTYHRRQKTKREGNKYSCIVHYINTCTFEHKKMTKFPMSISHRI